MKYLIPWFTQGLCNKFGNISAKGISKVKPSVDDFNRLFLYLHRHEIYKNKVWVLVDGDTDGKAVIGKFRESSYCKENGWDEEQFKYFAKDDFELYYPERFQSVVTSVLALPNGNEKREKKKALLTEVEGWIKQNNELAKVEFDKSAKEIVDILKSIDEKVNGKN